jgi:hypothetical protein
MNTKTHHKLVAIVAVDPDDRVRCGQPGCGHSVYARIHIVREGDELIVLGSTCFEKRYGSSSALGSAKYGGGSGRQLTAEERQLLVSNTALLLSHFEDERAHDLAVAAARVQELCKVQQRPSLPPPLSRWSTSPAIAHSKSAPWPWMKHMSSMLYIKLTDGTGWVRVQSVDSKQFLVPWPAFDGWDEALPTHVGTANAEHGGYELADVASALKYLRGMSEWEHLSGAWQEIRAQISQRVA